MILPHTFASKLRLCAPSCENLAPLNNYIVLSSSYRADDENVHEIRRYIHLADLMCFMREDEAVKTMGLFEGASESNRVNKTALKDWVVMIFSFFWNEFCNEFCFESPLRSSWA